MRKGVSFIWTTKHTKCINELKHRLLNSEVLAFPRFDVPFILAVDTSSHGIVHLLYQILPTRESEQDKSRIRVIRFESKGLSRWQKSYDPTKLELLGMVTSIMDCAQYLRSNLCGA